MPKFYVSKYLLILQFTTSILTLTDFSVSRYCKLLKLSNACKPPQESVNMNDGLVTKLSGYY